MAAFRYDVLKSHSCLPNCTNSVNLNHIFCLLSVANAVVFTRIRTSYCIAIISYGISVDIPKKSNQLSQHGQPKGETHMHPRIQSLFPIRGKGSNDINCCSLMVLSLLREVFTIYFWWNGNIPNDLSAVKPGIFMWYSRINKQGLN